MDAATQSRIFDPFFTTKFTGRGLGLPAVMGIVRGHKGAMRIESIAGQGSRFRIFLPVVHAPETEPAAATAPAPPAVQPDTRPVVLVVDDEEVVRSFTAKALGRAGFRVLVAEDGYRALEVFQTNPQEIAVVLLDLTMPSMSGQQTLAELRAIRADIKVVASSGYSQADALPRFA
jgi:CheY-like chemotaxis protein